MSINAISSVSLYEYYFTINKDKEKKSPLADEMKKYGLTPTDNESVNIALLEQAKAKERVQNEEQSKEQNESAADRPWADIMYQLNLPFNDNPLDDIQDIKDELKVLLADIKDEELESDITDLENYVEKLYINYSKNNVSSSTLLTNQLNNLSLINKVNLI